ncbi:hypothetical protein V7S57_02430 [Caulobacter sp. CCNWLY153]|uniref:hypothetical protein n=1 Tax=unclassified Caulobacter TaxID=2648921 RepID=UPI002FF43773
MANQNDAVHDALEALLNGLFTDAAGIVRNPDRYVEPRRKQDTADGLAAYVALEDDSDPDVLGTVIGDGDTTFDLACTPNVVLCFSGGKRDDRLKAARAYRDVLSDALKADRFLGGAAAYAEIDNQMPAEAGSADAWMAGGLMLGIRILFTGATKAG